MSYKQIADNISQSGFPVKDFLKTQEVFFRSDIIKFLHGKNYNFLTKPKNKEHTVDSFFIGCTEDENWISLNIIEDSNKLFMHTTLTEPSRKDVAGNYAGKGFKAGNAKVHLYEVGPLNAPVQTLIKAVNDIVAIKFSSF